MAGWAVFFRFLPFFFSLPVLTCVLAQLNFVIGAAGGGGGGGGGGARPPAQKLAPHVAVSAPLSFEISSGTTAAAGKSSKSRSKSAAGEVKLEGGDMGDETGHGKRRGANAVDYRAMAQDAGPVLDRKGLMGSASGAMVAPVPAPSPSVPKKAKKSAAPAKVASGPGIQPLVPTGAPPAPRVKKETAAPVAAAPKRENAKKEAPRLAPAPRERFAVGPPFINPDFRYPEDLMPTRPPHVPFDPYKSDARVEEFKAQIEQLERELNNVTSLEMSREMDRQAIQKQFKAKSVKARKLELDLIKKKGGRVEELSPEPLRTSSTSSLKKRPPKRMDQDYMDEYDEDEIMSAKSQRKAARSSGGGGAAVGASGGGAKKKSKAATSKLQSLPLFLQKAVRLLDELVNKPEALGFLQPVDPIALGIPDYHQYVKMPMDLGTMRTKCFEQKYTDIEGVAKDLELIFSNCVLFNSIDAPITADCKVLQKHWLMRLDKIRKQLDGTATGGGDESRRNRSAGRSSKAAPRPRVFKEMPFEEKAQLMGYIGELPPEQLSNVVQIVGEVRALDGGEQEGQEVEVDFETLPTETLRKLQEFVFGYRKQNGLEVKMPEGQGDDEVLLAGEEAAPSSSAATTATGGGNHEAPETPKSKKPRSQKPKKTESNVRAPVPKSHEELKALAEKTKENTNSALQELKDELKRMAGKVVDKDHVQGEGSGVVAGASEYSLDPAVLAQQLGAGADSDDSVSSDTVSSDDEDEGAGKSRTESKKGEGVHIIPVGEQGADVVIENAAGWHVEEGVASPAAGAAGADAGGSSGKAGNADEGLWEEFANKDAQQVELAKARKEHEEQLKREREAKEEELRKAEKEKRARQEEEERRRREEKEREEKEAQRIREEERLARKREREEEDEPRIDLAEQQRMMTDFERNK